MMRQPGNSRLFCVCMFDCCFKADAGPIGSTVFRGKWLAKPVEGLFAPSLMRVVCAQADHFLLHSRLADRLVARR
jgi:hypothetical protein